MNEMPSSHPENSDDELLLEYRFDYRQAKPNRFAAHNDRAALKVVVLDEDVAAAFPTPEAVNQALRAVIRENQK